MADYQNMYVTLFRSVTKAIDTLQEAQQNTEDMFIEAGEPIIRLLHPDADNMVGPDDNTDN